MATRPYDPAYAAALRRELAGYQQQGRTGREDAVRAELRRIGATTDGHHGNDQAPETAAAAPPPETTREPRPPRRGRGERGA